MAGLEGLEEEDTTHLFLYTFEAKAYVVFSPFSTFEPVGQVSTASSVLPTLDGDGHQYPWSLSPDISAVVEVVLAHFFSVGSTVSSAYTTFLLTSAIDTVKNRNSATTKGFL